MFVFLTPATGNVYRVSRLSLDVRCVSELLQCLLKSMVGTEETGFLSRPNEAARIQGSVGTFTSSEKVNQVLHSVRPYPLPSLSY